MPREVRRLVLSCEHATCAVPTDVQLGVPSNVLESHVGWDPGAMTFAMQLASRPAVRQRLVAPLLAPPWTRLVADTNRSPDTPGAVPAVAFGVTIPGNGVLTDAERATRILLYHAPHREAVASAATMAVRQGACFHLAVHSFDPSLEPARRAFDVGVLYDPARRAETHWALMLLDALRKAGVEARANAPYLGVDDGLTTALRTRLGPRYRGIELELNQAWADPRIAAPGHRGKRIHAGVMAALVRVLAAC